MTSQTCSDCGSAPASVCRACVWAIAARDYPAIGTRRRSRGADCVVCEAGPAALCGVCAVAAVAERRTAGS